MTKPLVVIIDHQSNREIVKRRIRDNLDRIWGQIAAFTTLVDERWNEDTLEFEMSALGLPITGSVTIEDSSVRIRLLLPLLFKGFAPVIASRIREEGRRLSVMT